METFIGVCLALLVIEIGLIMGAIVFLVLRLKRTAESVEVLAYRVEDQVASFGTTMRSGWFKALQGAAGLVGTLWTSRREN